VAIGPTTLAQMPAAIRDAVVHGIAHATSSVFFWAVLVTVVVPVLALLIKEVALRGGDQPTAGNEQRDELVEPALTA
jgi:hypothetical protein